MLDTTTRTPFQDIICLEKTHCLYFKARDQQEWVRAIVWAAIFGGSTQNTYTGGTIADPVASVPTARQQKK